MVIPIVFLHKMASAYSRQNWVTKIRVNRRWLLEENEIRDGVADAFQKLLIEEDEWRVDFLKGWGSMSLYLELPFSSEEVGVARLDMCKEKTLGPNGFIIGFLAI